MIMFPVMFAIISYGALLILLMSPTIPGIITVTVLFLLGLGLIVYKRADLTFSRMCRHDLPVPLALFVIACIVVYLGRLFYTRWFPSSTVQAIAAIFHIPIETMLLVGSILLAALSAYSLFLGLQFIVAKLAGPSGQNEYARIIEYCLITAFVTVSLSQIMSEVGVLSMGYMRFLWGAWIVAVVILFLYCVLNRMIPAIFIGAGLFMVLSTINAYVLRFRDRLFEPVDLFSAGTAMNVADNYSLFPIPSTIVGSWCFFAAIMVAFVCIYKKSKPILTEKMRLVLLSVCAASAIAIFFYAADLKTYHWRGEGAYCNGFILDYVSKIKEISVSEPGNYSTELIKELADQYAADDTGQANGIPEQPHIIVIMDEAFSDLSVTGELLTNTDVMPFVSSLKENTISGYALASVYGGNTANSEFEFLTGNSLAWMSPNVVPYQQYIRSSTYSMVSYLKLSHCYNCVAMHPYLSSGWNRPSAYGYLGFDKCYFIDDFPQLDLVRDYVSDQEMFEFLIKTYETYHSDPLFVFGVTMQNHGEYNYTGDNYTKHISLNEHGDEFPEVEQYLSLVHETDRAVEYLINYFQNVDDDVIIVFFGDHQPTFNESFYQKIRTTTEDSLDERQKRYMVPFFIWANYDIEEAYISCTSLNYLSSYVYEAAGIELPPYNHFLQELEKVIPSINANGFYSITSGCYKSFDEANTEELRWMDLYEALQYNNVFDWKNRNEHFFPVLE